MATALRTMVSLALTATPQPVPRVSWCIACTTKLPLNALLCGACLPAYLRARREEQLAEARVSIPLEFRTLRLDGDELSRRVPDATPDYLAVAREYLASTRVVLVGPSGAGKTSMGCAMLSAIIDDGLEEDCTPRTLQRARRARFVDALQLRKAVAEYPLGEGEAPLLGDAHHASVLLLDDVGKELEMRTAMNPIPELVRYRHARGLPTWVTTALDHDGMIRAYDVAHARRVFENAPPPLCLGEVL